MSQNLPVLELGVSSGHVSVVYFVVLEFITLAVIDIMLIHVVSSLWYNRIINGVALEVKTAEICGVANSLVGRYFAPPNLFAYAVKIALLSVILWTDINIYSRVDEITDEPRLLIGTFSFDPSSRSWGQVARKAVTRPWADITACRITNEDEIHFFRVRFNFTENRVYDDEFVDELFSINDSTIVCMKNGSATFEKESELEKIVSCSSLGTSKCRNETMLVRKYNIPSRSNFNLETIQYYVDEASKMLFYQITDFTPIADDIWPEYTTGNYSNPSLHCLKSLFSIRNVNEDRETSSLDTCLVIADVSYVDFHGTLVEVWDHSVPDGTFSRRFPGPIVARKLEVAVSYMVVVLRELPNQFQTDSWESFSARFISRGVVYEKSLRNVTPVTGLKTMTIIPVQNLVAVGVVLAITAIISLVVIRTVANDTKPRINTINGLSSIAREETEPVGRSLNVGAPMVIGLSERNKGEAHFGPLRSNDVRVSHRDVKHIA